MGLGLGDGDAWACDQGHGSQLLAFTGDGLGLAVPFRWLDAASARLWIKLVFAIGRLLASGGVGEGGAGA
jgi:hypothetical protein